jgi:tRNA nucleotidyltransferase/poly(A) polymerase
MSDESLQEKLINIVSQERMGQEIVKMLKNKNSDNSIKIMKDIGLFQRVLSKSLEGTEYEGKLSGLDMDQENKHHQLNLWNHTFRVIKNVLEFNPDLDEEKRIIMLLAALTHDLGKLCEWIKKKSEDGSSTSYVGHEDESAKIVNHLL